MRDVLRCLIQGRGLFVIVAALIAGVVGIQVLSLYRSYEASWTLASRSAENVLQTLSSNIERNLNLIELSLDGIHDTILLDGFDSLPAHIQHMLLFNRTGNAEFLGSMIVLDPQGKIRFDSKSVVPRDVDVSDREYFRIHLKPGMGTFFSKPFFGRLTNRYINVAMSRRISAADGALVGVAAASLRTPYFKNLFSQVDLGRNGVISLIKTDGVVISTFPTLQDENGIGTNVSGSALFRHMMVEPPQPFTLRAPAEGVDRYYVYRQIGAYPLLLSVGISTQDATRAWVWQAVLSLVLTLVVCAVLLLLVTALRRALTRSREAEEIMKTVAITDSLTGLPNRRAFDMTIGRELQHAARQNLPLSILMIDIDHFKMVNDIYGHAVGDEVLQRVGQAIARTCRRAGDLVARYGGEEFMVILPATPQADAMNLAEKIRSAIAEMRPSHTQPALERVTASIGVASIRDGDGMDSDVLTRRVDLAMYEAKKQGRNRVAAASRGEREAGIAS